MPETDIDAPEPPETPKNDDNIRKLRERAEQATAAEARAAAAERKLAIAEAGLNLSDPKIKFFAEHYQGDATAEAVKAAAETAGFLTETAPPPPTIPQEEADALTQIGQNVTGQGTPAPPPTREAELKAAIASGEIAGHDMAAAIGQWLAAKGEPVDWDGPIGGKDAVFPWGSPNLR